MGKMFIIITTILCFLTLGVIAGCGGKKEKPAQEKKSTELKKEAIQEEDLSSEEKEGPARYQSNTPPKIVSARILPDPAYTNSDLRVEVKGEDRDGDFITYTYQWMKANEGETVDRGEDLEGETSSTLSHEKFARGDALAVKITPFDGRSKGLTYRARYIVIANSCPEFVSSPPENLPHQKLYTYPVKATDPDDDPLTFSLGEGAPEGMTIDPKTGLITWTINPKTAGSYDIIINADDGHQGICSQRYTLTLEYKKIMPEEK